MKRVFCVLSLCLAAQSVTFGQANVAPTFSNLADANAQLWNAGLTVVDTNTSVVDTDSANFAGGFLT